MVDKKSRNNDIYEAVRKAIEAVGLDTIRKGPFFGLGSK